MKEYKIAVFTVDWNYELVESTLRGLKQYADTHENVYLRVFDCFGKETGTESDRIEYAVFELADLRRFDGLLIQGNQIVFGEIRDRIAQRIAETGIPAVSIDCPIPGCTLVGVDNVKAQQDITSHVIEAHNAQRLVYVTGLMDNGCPEGRERLEGFLNACRAKGIPSGNLTVIPGTWRTSDGVQVAREWLERNGGTLPDAFVCANDEMALGILSYLEEHGFRIPEDVIVTGFDNVASAELSTPRLCTVNRDNALLNYNALDMLIRKIDGKTVKDHTGFPHQMVFSESCGCALCTRPEDIRHRYFLQNRFLKNFYTLQDRMAEELLETNDLTELMEVVEKNRQILGCDNVYMCINGFYFDHYEKNEWEHDSETPGDEMVLGIQGKTGIEAPEGQSCLRFSIGELLPEKLMRRHRFLVFYPLHYNTYSIGYAVLDGISETAKLNLHKSIFSFLEIAIENVRKKGLLRQLNGKLDQLYVLDGLTGLYNRFGYGRYAETIFAAFREKGGARVLFADMDDLKGINDAYGHDVGDEAIKACARVIRESCRPEDFIMRYGGDEFLIICALDEDALAETIQAGLCDFNRRSGRAFRLALSIGGVDTESQGETDLEKCVQAADRIMYAAKSQRKKLKKQEE